MSVTMKTKMIDGVPHILDEESMTYFPTIKQDEQTGLTYTLDPETFTYVPNITLTVDERDIGRWGMKRKKFLKENKPVLYMQMFDDHTLTDHLIEVDEAAERMLDKLEAQMMEQEGVTEKLKATDQMEWVRRLNSIDSRVEEIILNELIYV